MKTRHPENHERAEGALWLSEVRYQDPRSQIYLGSPNILRLPDGALLACHDFFGPQACDRNGNIRGLVAIYRSEDNGQTWQQVNLLFNACWGSLFQHRKSVYFLGNQGEYGAIAIRRSDDGGFTWTYPYDEKTGLLFPAGDARTPPNWQCIGPVSHHKGRFFEDLDDLVIPPGEWWVPKYFQACVISAPDDCDLLHASNWIMSNHLPFDCSQVPDQSLVTPTYSGWLESSIVDEQTKEELRAIA
ncbi:MAG: exo-alpha-sialidase, partial [Victivallales bacterium]|nr:exo-alpha-sialidase [Victivallales bacterium]